MEPLLFRLVIPRAPSIAVAARTLGRNESTVSDRIDELGLTPPRRRQKGSMKPVPEELAAFLRLPALARPGPVNLTLITPGWVSVREGETALIKLVLAHAPDVATAALALGLKATGLRRLIRVRGIVKPAMDKYSALRGPPPEVKALFRSADVPRAAPPCRHLVRSTQTASTNSLSAILDCILAL
jgi:hypothetical protein